MYGARPMSRLIQEKIKQPLAEELLFGTLLHGGEVDVTVKDGQLAFQLTPAAPKKPRKEGGCKKAETIKAKIGNASSRERVGQYVSISVVAVPFKKNQEQH